MLKRMIACTTVENEDSVRVFKLNSFFLYDVKEVIQSISHHLGTTSKQVLGFDNIFIYIDEGVSIYVEKLTGFNPCISYKKKERLVRINRKGIPIEGILFVIDYSVASRYLYISACFEEKDIKPF